MTAWLGEPDLLEGCAKSCDECAAACEKIPDDKYMAMCAKACWEMTKHLAA